MNNERLVFRLVALKLLEIRSKNDYDAITTKDWIDEWLKEANLFAYKLYDAELDFATLEDLEED